MKKNLKYIHSIVIFFCLMSTTLYSRDKETATNFLSFSAGISSSFITGATAYQHDKFIESYRTELAGLNYNISSALLPRTTTTFGIKYGHPFNDKIMAFTGVFYTPRGFSENFSISDSAGKIADYSFQMIANYWDFYFGLKYKNSSGVTLGIGGMMMYNSKDIIKIKRTKVVNGQEVVTNTEQLFNEYYKIERNAFPAAAFISVGYEQRWWGIELESSYTTNIFLATAVEMNFVSVNLKGNFVILWK